jgi:ADP-ribose pyrophosphatase
VSVEGRTPGESPARPPGAAVASRRIYTGRVLNLDIDTVQFPNGHVGELEIIRHSGASAVVPFLDPPGSDDPRILLLRQYRYAAEDYLFEVPAGRLDPGESALSCAQRELREETGYSATAIRELGGFFTTPGFIDEFIHVFMAHGLESGAPSNERDECISLQTLTIKAALAFVDEGRIIDGKTIVSLFRADRTRRRL